MTNEIVLITNLLSNQTTITLVSAPKNKITDATKFEVNCSDCNINWITCIRILKKGIYCPACQVKGTLNQEQALFVISKRLPQMMFVRFPEGFKSNSSLVTLQCLKNKEHVITIKVANAIRLSTCKYCSGKYVFTEDEQIQRLKSKSGFDFIKLVEPYKDSHTKVLVKCRKDGFEWSAKINPLVHDRSGCPLCAGNLNLPEEDIIEKINALPNFKFIEFPNGYISQKDKVTVFCTAHEKDWTSSIFTTLKGMTGCDKCRADKVRIKRRVPEEVVINKINKLQDIRFISFHESYVNTFSKVTVQCLIDGNLWTPTIDNLNTGRGCPKCSKVYKYSHEERLEQINDLSNIELVQLIDGTTKAKSRVKIRCQLDGFEWETTIDPLIQKESGCPRCASNSWDLKQTLKNPYTWKFKRWIYYVKFQHISGVFFWKIGLSKGETIVARYAANVLLKDGLSVVDFNTICLSNFDATLAEYFVLTRFAKYSGDYRYIMVNSKGGTECFTKDILNSFSLEEIVEQAKSIDKLLISEVETKKQLFVSKSKL